jgi:hypothetical protein
MNQVGDHVWVVPVSEKRAEGHYGHNGKLTFEKAKTPTTNTNTPSITEYPKFPKFHRVRQTALGVTTNPRHEKHSVKTNLYHNGKQTFGETKSKPTA